MKLIVKTWQTKFWNLSLFLVQDLACQVLNHYIVLQIHVPKSWKWLYYSRLGILSLELFGVPNFIMSFMAWSSKTWTQVKIIVKTWQTKFQHPTHFFVQDLGCQVLKCYIVLQIHVPTSWHWLHFSRLGVPSIEAFWGNQFQH